MTIRSPITPGAELVSAAGNVYQIREVLGYTSSPYLADGDVTACEVTTAVAQTVVATGPMHVVVKWVAPGPGIRVGAFVRATPSPAEIERWVDVSHRIRGSVDVVDSGTILRLAQRGDEALGRHGVYRARHPEPEAFAGRFVALPYVCVVSLAALQAAAARAPRTPLPPRVAAGIAVQLANALAALHTTPVVPGVTAVWHGALDRGHVGVDDRGFVRLISPVIAVGPSTRSDRWGDLRQTAQERTAQWVRERVTPEGVVGSPAASSSDLFRLGAVLWELIAGRWPFAGDSLIESLTVAARGPRPALPDSPLDGVLQSLLAIDPRDRPATAHDAAVEIDAAARAVGLASPDEFAAHLGAVVTDEADGPDAARASAPHALALRWRPLGSVGDAADWPEFHDCVEPVT